ALPALNPVSRLAPASGLASAAPAPAAAPTLSAAPAAAPFENLGRLAEGLRPELEALQSQEVQGEAARGLAESLMAPVLGRGAPAAETEVVPSLPERTAYKPLVSQVAFSEDVPAARRDLLLQSLSRRKAGWKRGLANMGLDLGFSAAPVMSARSAKDVKGGKTAFVVEWRQGELRVGVFKAYVSAKNLDPQFYRLAAPEPPKERQLKIRFVKSIVLPGSPLGVEQNVSESDIAAFLETAGLRLLRKSWDGYYQVAVTGNARPEEVARKLSGRSLVLYATPELFSVPAANQVRIAFKKSTARLVAEGVWQDTYLKDSEIGELLARFGLRVLSVDRGGIYTAGAEGLRAQAAARALQLKAEVLYAAPVEFAPAWTSQLIVKFRESYVFDAGGIYAKSAVSEDNVASVLKRHGLLVVSVLGERLYKVARVKDGAPAKAWAGKVAAEPVVESALPLGGLSEEKVRAAAHGAISRKGRPWSSTEYNAAYAEAYWKLETAGATPEQMGLFQRLCDEAPVRGGGFNPWSGD
ncbi:MAG: hypothetical protein PHF00_09310, partial [Elusimicrobia bacterium]|nr:hypothetical protein [Elusimicrobiota bacterium]